MKTFTRVQEVNATLARTVVPCAYADSTRLSRPGEWPTFDGTRYTVEGYRNYAGALMRQIAAMPEVRAAAQRR